MVKKVFNIIKKVLFWAVVVFAVAMMVFTVVSVTTFDRVDRSIFGYKAFIVLSDSMSATDFNAGDIVLVRQTDVNTLQVGDIIAFQSSASENYGEVVTHKIRRITTDAEGQLAFITYGTTTNTDDEAPVSRDFVIGKYQFRLAGVGNFFRFLKTTPGYIVCILVPFLLLIMAQAVNAIRLFRRYRAEQMAELQEEKAKLEAERADSERLKQELLELKAQIFGDAAKPAQPTEAEPVAEQPVEVEVAVPMAEEAPKQEAEVTAETSEE